MEPRLLSSPMPSLLLPRYSTLTTVQDWLQGSTAAKEGRREGRAEELSGAAVESGEEQRTAPDGRPLIRLADGDAQSQQPRLDASSPLPPSSPLLLLSSSPSVALSPVPSSASPPPPSSEVARWLQRVDARLDGLDRRMQRLEELLRRREQGRGAASIRVL